MKPRFLATIMTAVLLVASTSSAAASVRVGEPCPKMGKVAKGLTCKKVGKRLIWVRSAKKPATKQVPTPPPAPPKTYISPVRDEVSRTIDALLLDAIKGVQGQAPTVTWYFHGPTTEEVLTKTKRSLDKAMPIYAALGFEVTSTRVYVARDMLWLSEALSREGCQTSTLPPRPGFYLGACPDRLGAVTAVHWDIEPFSDGMDGLYFNHVIPHEYFHHIQEKSSQPGMGNGDFPRWFWEGSAQFFTNIAWSAWNPSRGYVEWYEHWWSDLRPDFGPQACRSATIEVMSDPTNDTREAICAYSKGQLLVEFLVSKYGLERYHQLYRVTGAPGWQGFAARFMAVTGDELSEFYRHAEPFLARRGW